MIELTLLKALSKKEAFDQYRHLLNPKTLSQHSLMLLKDYEAYFHKFEEHSEVDFNLFPTYFFQSRHPYLDEKSILEYKEILNQLSTLHVNGEVKDIYLGFEKQEFYNDLQNKLNSNIDIEQLVQDLQTFVDKTSQVKEETDNDLVTINQMLQVTERKEGLRWRLRCLDTWFQEQGLNKGDLVIIAASPGAGKTSFLASELSHMAGQLDEGVVYYLSNEGGPENVASRIYCSLLNCTEADIRKFPEKAREKYAKLLNGDEGRIRVKSIQGWSAKDIEKLIKEKEPKLVVIDLLDHVNGFSKYLNKENSYEMYNKLYQWAREISTQYCPILVASQLNGDAWDKPDPSISNLRGSRIDKQAAATFQIVIGKMTGQDNVRYISLVKDKLGIGYKNVGVKFDPLRSRFI